MKNIAVFFGGKSCEHDISVITGVLTVNSLNNELFTGICIYVDRNGTWYTGEDLKDISFYKNINYKKLNKVTMVFGDGYLYKIKRNKLEKFIQISCAINCMHGLNGEDGSLAGVMKMSNISLVGSDIFASSLAMDKDFTKIALTGLNVSKLPHVRIYKTHFYSRQELAVKLIESKHSYPVIIKPARLGSSIGVYKCSTRDELINNLIKAFKYDNKVIVEQYLSGFKEVNCACYKIGDELIVSECEEPITSNDILSFKDKYESGSTEVGADKKFPADIPINVSNKIKNITKNVYRKCGFFGIIRIDYMLYNNKIYLNEINCVPGSMAYYLFCDTLKDFSVLLTKLIMEAINVNRAENNLEYVFNSNVLTGSGIKGGKGKIRRNSR